MQHLIILSKISNQTIGLIWGIFFGGIFILEFIRQKFSVLGTHQKQPTIMMPRETLQLKDLDIGITIFVLDIEKDQIMAQTIENYQNGMRTRIFENTFWFDNQGKHTLEKGKTYEVAPVDNEGTKTLNKVALFITPDSVIGC